MGKLENNIKINFIFNLQLKYSIWDVDFNLNN